MTVLDRSISILEQLISFPTISRTSNLGLIRYVQDLVGELGIDQYLVASEDGERANLYLSLGPASQRGVLLSGHTDVVPTTKQHWYGDPFRLRFAGGCLFGRGTADMKGFIACVLAIFEASAKRRFIKPVQLALSYDEEIGCLGMQRLSDAMFGFPVLPSMCIVGEPTNMQTITSHKSIISGNVVCRGHSCHSSFAPEGLNAIHLAMNMVSTFRALQEDIYINGYKDPDFSFPFTTLHVGIISGGTAVNIVPDSCNLEFEVRSLPDDNPDILIDRLAAEAERLTRCAYNLFPEAGVSIKVINHVPNLVTSLEEPIVAALERWRPSFTMREKFYGKVAYGTEGGILSTKLGIPTVVCGPGSIQQAHRADEFITIDQMSVCIAMLERLVDEMCA